MENALSVPHCCCKVAGKKVVSDHKEIFSKLLPQSCSGTYCLAPRAQVTLLLGKSGVVQPSCPARGKPREWKRFQIKPAVLWLEGRATRSAQTWRHTDGNLPGMLVVTSCTFSSHTPWKLCSGRALGLPSTADTGAFFSPNPQALMTQAGVSDPLPPRESPPTERR